MVHNVKDLNEFKTIMKDEMKLIVVLYSAEWCFPCKSIKPLFHELAEKNRDIIFLTVDMNEASDVAAAMKIVSVPTFQFYRKGVEIHEVIGADEDALRKGIDKCLAIVHHENPNQCSSFESSNLHYKISVDEDI